MKYNVTNDNDSKREKIKSPNMYIDVTLDLEYY